LVNSNVGSSWGTNEDDGSDVWPLDTKKSMKAWRMSETVENFGAVMRNSYGEWLLSMILT
jgi:hypothetical protein